MDVMDIEVFSRGILRMNGEDYPCALGEGGVTEAKTEGDKKTPLGAFPLREVFWRKDRIPEIHTGLPKRALRTCDGWCDDASSPFYNQHIFLPAPEHHETMWRSDNIYDIVVSVGYNMSPAVPGKGSAIFIHIAREGLKPTDGCIALKKEHLLEILPFLNTKSHIWIKK